MSASVRPTPGSDLVAVGADLVRALGGNWDPRRAQGICNCPAHDDRSPSLSVRVGEKALLFHCFAGCESHDVAKAIGRRHPLALRRGVSGVGGRAAVNAGWLQTRIHDLWTDACPIDGTVAAHYLANRAILRSSDALRYHSRTPLGGKGDVVFRPAMLAAVHDGGTLVAVQRTFLDLAGGGRARDIAYPRRLLGRPGRGCVRLASAADILGLAEGVESAFSAMILLGIPVWAVLGSQRLAKVVIPASVRRLVLLADNDRAGRLAVEVARDVHARTGHTIDVEWPWHGLNDWNDVLRQERRE